MSTGSVARPIATVLRGASTCLAAPVASTSRSLISGSAPLAPIRPVPLERACGCSGGIRGARGYSSYPSEKPAALDAPPLRKKRTLLDIQALKRKRIPITMLTAHDYPSGRFIEAASLPPSPSSSTSSPSQRRGIDICLVGDSLAMVACGYTSTTSLTLDELLYHCRSVARGCLTSLLVADLPFGTYYASVADGVKNAIRLVQEGNMDAVKIEGGTEIVPLVEHLTRVGIPVMAHVGLTPQRQASLGGYRVQGKTVASALKVLGDAQALEKAGAFAVVLEAVPSELAAFVTQQLKIPTIGIGAGSSTDGQVLVQLDMLGVNASLGSSGTGPRFVKRFGVMGEMATRGISEYVEEVRERTFPEEGTHTYPMKEAEWEAFLKAVEGRDNGEGETRG
ncbi:hypothetical protein JCM1841_003293 [Sporobolomyces salmonicolor]